MTALPPIDPAVQAGLEQIAHELSGATEVVIATHVSPDGDALGSSLALGIALRARGIEVTVGWGDPSCEVVDAYDFLPGQELIAQPADFPEAPVAVTVDCATAERLGGIRSRIESGRVLNIDHHVSNTRFGAVDVIDADAPSTTELVLRLLLAMGAEVTPDIATCLYVGLSTDTGQFSYANATPRAHAAAACMIGHGVDVAAISQAVFESAPFGYLKLLGRVLERSRRMADPPLVISWLTQADLEECEVGMDDTEEIITVLRSTKDADAAGVLKERTDGTWKGSLRSKGETDVGAVAQALGGGGHTLAAGFSVTGSVEEALTRVHEALRDVGRSPA